MSQSFIDWEKGFASELDYRELDYEELMAIFRKKIEEIKRLNKELKLITKILLNYNQGTK